MSGFVTAHFAALNKWIASFGPIGYWSAGLLGALIVALMGLLLARARIWWATGAAIDKWKLEVANINPLSANFTGQRIRFADLAHPITHLIQGKTFLNCELMGPSNLLIANDMTLQGITFCNCDVVVWRPGRSVSSAIVLQHTNIIGGSVWNCTIFIAPELVQIFEKMNANFVSFKVGEQYLSQQTPTA